MHLGCSPAVLAIDSIPDNAVGAGASGRPLAKSYPDTSMIETLTDTRQVH